MGSNRATFRSQEEKTRYVRGIFDSIAPNYDRANLLISLGQTTYWRNLALKGFEMPERILDVGCGTGESTRFLATTYPEAQVEGIDLSQNMIAQARQCDPEGTYQVGDVMNLPYEDKQFDLVTTVYTTRNFPDFKKSMQELMRVTAPGGTVAILDCFADRPPLLWRGLQKIWMRGFVPILVRIFNDPEPYRYLADSIDAHISIESAVDILYKVGAVDVQVRDFSFGSASCLYVRV